MRKCVAEMHCNAGEDIHVHMQNIRHITHLHVLQYQQYLAILYAGAVELHHIGIIAQAPQHGDLLPHHQLRVCQRMLQDL